MTGAVGARPEELSAVWLGTVDYGSALDIQRSVLEARKSSSIPDTLILLDHPHAITLGRRADESHILADRTLLNEAGVQVFGTDRGGEATYHGPGQLVGYPIIDVRGAGLGPVTYVRLLESVLIEILAKFGINGHVVDQETGVWVGGAPNEKREAGRNPRGKKIAAIGVRISGGVTMHGFALNLTTDTSYFEHIVPCGMRDLSVTSVEIETGQSISTRECSGIAASVLASKMQRSLVWTEQLVVPVSSLN
ncbi:MAG: lipoyl(octanoyl) transferase LipB [Chloroflexi bacterium]|nr:lipoyl(octanoyl) transferase LipB [Chloroflexota bacterium]